MFARCGSFRIGLAGIGFDYFDDIRRGCIPDCPGRSCGALEESATAAETTRSRFRDPGWDPGVDRPPTSHTIRANTVVTT